ncbi:glycoside hydrolase family, partial [gut metagenome]
PANMMVIRFTADTPAKQNLVFSYAPNPVSEGRMQPDGAQGLVYSGALDNNGMRYVVRIQAACKGGSLTNSDGKLSVKGADEVVFYVTADTDYKPNFDPDFSNPLTYVGVNPDSTTKQW